MLDRTFTVVAPAHWTDDQVRVFGQWLVRTLEAFPAPQPDLRVVESVDG